MHQLKIVIEKHPEGYVAYPLGLNGIVVGEGDTYEEALADVKSAIQFHIETIGESSFPQSDEGLSRGEFEGGVFSRNRFLSRAKLW